MVRGVQRTDELPRVLVCALGGTIAMTRGDGRGVVPTQSAQSLVDAVPELTQVADIEATSFRQVPGAHLTLADVVELATFLDRSADGYDGFVITQGTDTLEETAGALDMMWVSPIPVVVTGAMRNPTIPGSDGPANLLAAVTVAASSAGRDAGVLAVLGDEIHAGRLVQKRHTTRPSAFESPAGGPIGVVSEGVVHRWSTPQRVILSRPDSSAVPPVALLRLGMGEDGRLVEAVRSLGYRGLVVEAFGGGHVPPLVGDSLAAVARDMPVVLASRTGAGPVLHNTYGFPGSETDLLGRGLVSAGTWDGLKARILLSLALGSGMHTAAIAALFAE